MDDINFALLLIRVVIGLTMIAHGWNHLFGGGRIPGMGRWFEGMGMRYGVMNAWLATITEFVTGALMVVGLLTTFAAAGMVGLLVVAIYTVHRTNGFFVLKEGWEYVFMYAVIAVVVAMLGPGEWSLDDALGIADDLDGWTGFVIAAGLGTAGGVAQLAAFYRPTPDAG